MARRASNRSSKAVIRVFCEGESEQAYIDFLKMQFQDVAAIKYPRGTGLFETAKDTILARTISSVAGKSS